MELAVRSRVESNTYEEARQPEPTDTQPDKTEDIYQTLHNPSVTVTMPPAAPETSEFVLSSLSLNVERRTVAMGLVTELEIT